MANTYSQISIHAIFAVKHRQNVITRDWRDDLHRYIAGIITNKGAKQLAVGGWKDHIHIFFGLPLTQNIPEFMSIIKSNSSRWINEQRFTKGKFEWQTGYGAFSYSRSQRNTIINYIINQEEHHRNKTFKEEYLEILNDFEIDYSLDYLFDFFDK